MNRSTTANACVPSRACRFVSGFRFFVRGCFYLPCAAYPARSAVADFARDDDPRDHTGVSSFTSPALNTPLSVRPVPTRIMLVAMLYLGRGSTLGQRRAQHSRRELFPQHRRGLWRGSDRLYGRFRHHQWWNFSGQRGSGRRSGIRGRRRGIASDGRGIFREFC